MGDFVLKTKVKQNEFNPNSNEKAVSESEKKDMSNRKKKWKNKTKIINKRIGFKSILILLSIHKNIINVN